MAAHPRRDAVLFVLLGLIWGSVYLAVKIGGDALLQAGMPPASHPLVSPAPA